MIISGYFDTNKSSSTIIYNSSYVASFTATDLSFEAKGHIPLTQYPIALGLTSDRFPLACGPPISFTNSTACYFFKNDSWHRTFGLTPLRFALFVLRGCHI